MSRRFACHGSKWGDDQIVEFLCQCFWAWDKPESQVLYLINTLDRGGLDGRACEQEGHHQDYDSSNTHAKHFSEPH